MQSVEKKARTVEEAIDRALDELGVSRDAVEVEVISEPSKGVLGIGSRRARVRVTVRRSSVRAGAVLEKVLSLMNIEAQVHEREASDEIRLEVDSPDSALLIGKKGKNLEAIQYLINRIYNQGRLRRRRIVVDIEAYRARREQDLEDLARRSAEKVKKNGRQVKLHALNPRDRRRIHVALQNDPAVRTYSVGSGALRNVVIAPSDERDGNTYEQRKR